MVKTIFIQVHTSLLMSINGINSKAMLGPNICVVLCCQLVECDLMYELEYLAHVLPLDVISI